MAISSRKRLYKSTEFNLFTGVAAGIADYLETSHTVVRCLFILLSFFNGIGLVFYITLSVLLPTEKEVNEQEDEEFYYQATHGITPQKTRQEWGIISPTNIVSLLIISMAAVILQFNIVPWKLISGDWIYPALIITVGVSFIIKSLTSRKNNL